MAEEKFDAKHAKETRATSFKLAQQDLQACLIDFNAQSRCTTTQGILNKLDTYKVEGALTQSIIVGITDVDTPNKVFFASLHTKQVESSIHKLLDNLGESLFVKCYITYVLMIFNEGV